MARQRFGQVDAMKFLLGKAVEIVGKRIAEVIKAMLFICKTSKIIYL